MDLFIKVMEIFAIFFVIYSTLYSTEGAKNYRFVSLESCKTDNELIVAFKKCEIDGIYLTFITEVKSPITKLIVSFWHEFYQKLINSNFSR